MHGNSHLFLYLFIALIGCAQAPQYEVVKPEYERVTSEARELELLQLQPTEFIATPAETDQLWQRAELFASQYLGTTPTVSFQSAKSHPDSTSLQFKSENYRYSVSKQKRAGNIIVGISCIPLGQGGDKSKADLNAGNLARFVKEGRLQLNLLAR